MEDVVVVPSGAQQHSRMCLGSGCSDKTRGRVGDGTGGVLEAVLQRPELEKTFIFTA